MCICDHWTVRLKGISDNIVFIGHSYSGDSFLRLQIFNSYRRKQCTREENIDCKDCAFHWLKEYLYLSQKSKSTTRWWKIICKWSFINISTLKDAL